MMYTNELMLMMSRFLYGEYDPEAFSFDFPARLAFVYDEFINENKSLCDWIEDEMPEICGWFDPHNTGCEGTYGEDVFREKVYDVYVKALAFAKPLMKQIS